MRRRTALRILAVVTLLGLAGCGFRPLYGGGQAAGTVPELAAIKVKPIPDRIGQQIHNNLVGLFDTAHSPAQARYDLQVEINDSTQRVAIQRNELATRANYRLNARYVLSADGQRLFGSSRSVISSYNILVSDFATLAAAEDAKARAAREIADAIRTSLAIYFTSRRSQQGPIAQ